MSTLQRWFAPELALVVGIPLATVRGGMLTLLLVRGDLSADGEHEGVRAPRRCRPRTWRRPGRGARGPVRAPARGSRARRGARVAAAAVARTRRSSCEFLHSLHAERDLHARLHERDGAWVAALAPDAGSRWRVVLADRAQRLAAGRHAAARRRDAVAATGAAAAMNARLPAPALCAHCGEARSRARQYCCAGCAAAADWIRRRGLADYYRLRSEAGNRVRRGAWTCAPGTARTCSASTRASKARNARSGSRSRACSCAACAWLVDRALRAAGRGRCRANAASGRLRLRWRAGRHARCRRCCSACTRSAIAPSWAATRRARSARRERNALLLRLGVAALVGMQAMMFAEAPGSTPAGRCRRRRARCSAG
jgi:hypothetical protein